MNPVALLWIGAAVIFIIIEAATMGLTTIWFAVAALVALVASIFNFSPLLQITVFLVVSAVLIYFTRPLAVKYLKIGTIRTNADKLVGGIGKVTEEIDNMNGKGLVKISGQVWTSRSLNETIIPINSLVKVDRIDGVKLIVKEMEEKQ